MRLAYVRAMKKNGPFEVLFASLVLCYFGSACHPGTGGENPPIASAENAVVSIETEDTAKVMANPEAGEEEMDMEMMADKRPQRVLTKDGSVYVRSETVNRPLVRFPDGQLSNSDSCAVRMENKLSRAVPPAYVNGQPIGFC